MICRIILSLLLVLTVSCTKDKPDAPTVGDTAPSAPVATAPSGSATQSTGSRTISIGPEIAYSNSTLRLSASGFQPPLPGGEDRIVWQINGTPVSSADPLSMDLREYLVSKGDTVQAVAYLGGAQINSNLITIMNNPPRIASYAFFDPGEESGNIGIEVETADDDGDPVSLEYRWTFNGMPAGTGKMPDLSPSPDDDIQVAIKAFDGDEYSDEVTAKFTILSRPPRFEMVQGYFMSGSTYIYNASATDPDLEPVTFSLDREPPGMAVDPGSGQVRWDVPGDFLGTIEYTIVATDPHGLNAVLPMKFSVLKE